MIISIVVFAALLVLAFAAITSDESGPVLAGGLVATAIAALVIGLYAVPSYTVWEQGMVGQSELRRAEQNRQIKIEEAKAELESAKLKADAEIARARGAAEANAIMTKSLEGDGPAPDRYLRWRWISMLEANEKSGINREVIYVPADGNFPMTEAGRAITVPAKKE